MAGLFGAIFRPKAEISSLTLEEFFRLNGAGAMAKSGVMVSPETALKYTTVLICVRVLAESVASLPCILYRRRADGGKERATDHPLLDRPHRGHQILPLPRRERVGLLYRQDHVGEAGHAEYREVLDFRRL